jgi:calcineurin-like phosphoesterase family protein
MDEMIKIIIQRWNSRVKKKDIAYIIGDVAFGNPKNWVPIIRQLQGTINLVRGNHDLRNGATMKRLCVDGVPMFNDIADVEHISINGIRFLLCHYPYAQENDGGRMMEMRPRDAGEYLIHGHTHCPPIYHDRMINVSCNLHNYFPVSSTQILELIKSKGEQNGIPHSE